ncbi:MAG: response regulator [Magnetococcales bacterium]|nr:response regulator [Magnetococcales bacterium]
MRTLIVDDELNNRYLLQQIMAPYGECDLAENGAEALEFFQAAMEDGVPYDLVLLDIMMPVMNGQDALRAIRSYENQQGHSGSQETVIIMVSALDTENHVVNAFFKGGCTDYLTKPVMRPTLLAKLQEYNLIHPGNDT